MRKRISVLTLMSILIVLFLVPALYARNEVSLFLTKEKPLYSSGTKMFYGEELQLFLNKRSFYLDISERLAIKQNPSGIENFSGNLFRARIETSIWRFFVANVSFNFHGETEGLCPFNQPEIIVMVDKWYENEITAGLGVKTGHYDGSHISFTGIFGNSYRRHIEDLKFLDTKSSYHHSSRVVGASIKGRLELSRWLQLWIDFRGDYNYYLQHRKHRTEFTASIGIKIVKHLGIKGGATVINTENRLHFIRNKYCVGLVWIF